MADYPDTHVSVTRPAAKSRSFAVSSRTGLPARSSKDSLRINVNTRKTEEAQGARSRLVRGPVDGAGAGATARA